jgi:hypothetical protein
MNKREKMIEAGNVWKFGELRGRGFYKAKAESLIIG